MTEVKRGYLTTYDDEPANRRVAIVAALLGLAAILALGFWMDGIYTRARAHTSEIEQSITAIETSMATDVDVVILRDRLSTLESENVSLTAMVESLGDTVRELDIRQESILEVISQDNVSRGTNVRRDITNVERWRSLVEVYFDAEYVDDALSVMMGESHGDPDALGPKFEERGVTYQCCGLFQQHPRYWAARSAAAGFAGASIFDPEANIAASAKLSKGGSDWGHWVVKP